MITNDTQAAVDAGVALAGPSRLGESSTLLHVTLPEGGQSIVLDTRDYDEKHALNPARKIGRYQVTDGPSLVEYVRRHGTESTELWANVTARSVTAIINGHGEALPGHSDHTCVLNLVTTPEWQAWLSLDRKQVAQATFAEHIEDNLRTIADPSGADLLDLVTTLKVAKSADFESATRLSTGEIQFGYRETQTATAGQKGELSVPEVFTLALQPFQGGDQYKVTARLRYRMSEGNLSIGYVLDQPDAILEAAFAEVLANIRADVEPPIFSGVPQR